MRYFPEPVDDLDLIDGVYARTQAAVHAEDLVVDHHAEGQEVEHVGEVVPHVRVAVFTVALGVKAVRLRYASRLVVSSNQVHACWVAKLEADKKGYCFDGEKTAVDVVTWSGIVNYSCTSQSAFRCEKNVFDLRPRKKLLTYLGKGNWYLDKSLQF